MTMLDWAKRYRSYNWSIFPCTNKQPLVQWRQYAERLPTEAEVIAWWTMWPDAQIAVACGKLSGITVLDIDHGNEEPDDIAVQLWNKGVFTLTSCTGGGGRHLFCKFNDVKNSVKLVHPQMDVKSHGGYVILPPSSHASGNAYRWHEFTEFGDDTLANLASFPTHLIPTITEERPPTDWQKFGDIIHDGERNVSFTKICGALIRAFPNSPKLAWQFAEFYNAKFIRPCLDDDEMTTTFESVYKIHRRNYATEI